ncbi:MAG: TetR/AcrR family transcriptional regulator [Streptosporangiaceae bacterium]
MAEQLRRERLRREMIDEIIGTARLLLEKDGPSAISVRAIARQVGVTGPAIYRYYPSLNALMSALSESVISELCAAVESARDQSGGMAREFRGWALDHPASFRFALGLDGHRTAGQTLMGRLPRPSVSPASMLGWATLCGLVLLELGCDREDLAEDIGRLYAAAGLHGLTGPRE